MAFPFEGFTAFVSGAPLANTPGSSDMLPIIQGGVTKRIPVGTIPQLTVAPTTEVTGAAYALLLTDEVIFVNRSPAAATVLTLPSNPGAGRVYTVKDIAGNVSGGNNIAFANGTIDGNAAYQITTAYGSLTIISTGIGNNWGITAKI